MSFWRRSPPPTLAETLIFRQTIHEASCQYGPRRGDRLHFEPGIVGAFHFPQHDLPVVSPKLIELYCSMRANVRDLAVLCLGVSIFVRSLLGYSHPARKVDIEVRRPWWGFHSVHGPVVSITGGITIQSPCHILFSEEKPLIMRVLHDHSQLTKNKSDVLACNRHSMTDLTGSIDNGNIDSSSEQRFYGTATQRRTRRSGTIGRAPGSIFRRAGRCTRPQVLCQGRGTRETHSGNI